MNVEEFNEFFAGMTAEEIQQWYDENMFNKDWDWT
jgi:hypothetical protein